MAKCSLCGEEFDLTYARRYIGRAYGAGVYNEYYPDGDICVSCAIEEIGADYNAGAELIDLMGTSFEWD